MSWSFREENFVRPPMGDVLMRKYPFPYKAGVTISNDTDRMNVNAFDDLHDYVNGTDETPYGPGLGLEMSDSFWIWSESKCFSLSHSSPFDEEFRLSPEGERIIALCKSGIIDTLHNFGQWRVQRHMKREDAERGLEILQRLGLSPKIWINHGGELMQHQIEGRWGITRLGDDPHHESYCYDLLRNAGLLYFSHAYMAEERRFGEHRAYRDQGEFERDLGSVDFNRWLRLYNKVDKTFSCPYGEQLHPSDEIAIRRRLFNKVLVPETAKDGSPLLFFKRFRGLDRPSVGSFVTQINYYSLKDLVRIGACAVVYQHFGVNRPAMSNPDVSRGTASKPPVLDIHSQTAFENLAAFNRNGEVWVPTLERFLDFLRLRDFVDFDVRREGETNVIAIKGIECPVQGRTSISLDQINGISFLVPKSAGEYKVILGEKDISQYFKREADTVFPTREALYIPYERRSRYIHSKNWYGRTREMS